MASQDWSSLLNSLAEQDKKDTSDSNSTSDTLKLLGSISKLAEGAGSTQSMAPAQNTSGIFDASNLVQSTLSRSSGAGTASSGAGLRDVINGYSLYKTVGAAEKGAAAAMAGGTTGATETAAAASDSAIAGFGDAITGALESTGSFLTSLFCL